MKRLTLSRRLALSLALGAVILGAPAALAQDVALSRPLPPIPAPGGAAYPGVIDIEADATDLDRRIIRVRQTIPVAGPGPLVLFYPAWIPGNHGPVGPVRQLAGLVFTAGGQTLAWTRDPLDTFAYHIEVPAGATQVEAAFQWLTPLDGAQGRVVVTDEMLNLQWEKALLYPAGYDQRRITFRPRLRLPPGWSHGAALEAESVADGVTTFAPITLEHLADSPVFAGAHYRRIDLDPSAATSGRPPVRLNLVADTPEMLAATDAHIDQHRALVRQADRLFGSRPFDRYDFLVAVTNRLGGIGLEHHRSSENSVDTRYFTTPEATLVDRDLLAHEYVHSWIGKHRRPADQMVANLNTPLRNSLLWVYEGQTQYWGLVLTARAGLMSREQALDVLAMTAASFQAIPGREWRALQDTTNDPIVAQRRPQPWASWQRSEDYYREGALVWLDADTLIRERSGGRRSLDDFARAFFGGEDGVWQPRPFDFEQVVEALNTVQPHDWAGFLRQRLDAVGPDAAGPLGGLERGGYRLVFRDAPNGYMKALNAELGRNDFQYSLGLMTNNANRITAVTWGGPAFELGLSQGWDILAVNGRAASAAALSEAVTRARDGGEAVEIIVRRDERFRTVRFDYRGGLRYPHLERIAGTPDRLGDLLAPRGR